MGGQDKCSTRVKRYFHRIHKEEQKPYVTKESTKEGTKHRVRQRCKESTELANHPKQEHEGCSILYNPATSNLHENKKESTLEKSLYFVRLCALQLILLFSFRFKASFQASPYIFAVLKHKLQTLCKCLGGLSCNMAAVQF